MSSKGAKASKAKRLAKPREGSRGPVTTDTRWKPGQSGNPNGRPKGSRHKLNEFFLRDLQALWEVNGDAILQATMRSKPDAIVKAMIALLPRQVQVSAPLDDMTDEQLAFIAEQLLAKYGSDRASVTGPGSEGDEAPRLPKPAGDIQTVPEAS